MRARPRELIHDQSPVSGSGGGKRSMSVVLTGGGEDDGVGDDEEEEEDEFADEEEDDEEELFESSSSSSSSSSLSAPALRSALVISDSSQPYKTTSFRLLRNKKINTKRCKQSEINEHLKIQTLFQPSANLCPWKSQ